MKTNLDQFNASDPSSSIWVFASAGTGKTKILVDRFLRFILSGVSIDKIICITFTKAASNEMVERIINKISSWSNLDEEELIQSIFAITNKTPNIDEVQNARSVYDQIIKSNKKLGIQTIHSLCQNILLKFPIEAGINSNFKIMDQSVTDSIITEIKSEIFFKNNSITNNFILENINDLIIIDLIQDIINNHIKFQNFFDKYKAIREYEEFIIRLLNIKSQNKENIYKELETLRILPKINNEITLSKNDRKLINFYNNYYILSLEEKAQNFNEFKYSFLNKDNSKKKKLLSNDFANSYPDIDSIMVNTSDLIYKLDQELKNFILFEFSIAFYSFSQKVIQIFIDLKLKNHYLSYDDLIDKTFHLLNNAHMKDWVLYKLDGGFDHILIDEAQDTSPMQWQIIQALVEEFFSGQSYKDIKRSLFVVGDDKQSIYSFQGANINNYILIKDFFKNKIQSSQNNFSEIILNKSYRSSKTIIKSIDFIMNHIKSKYPNNSKFTYNSLQIEKEEEFGQIEIWPLSIKDKKSNNISWPLPYEIEEQNNKYTNLCNNIVNFIKSEMEKNNINFKDFMILVRKRDNFISELIKNLEENGIKTSGLDRINLKENLSVMDLISLAKFLMLPNDDLNLSGLLLSPIIGYDDQMLLEIALSRKSSIWEVICDAKTSLYYKLIEFFDLYKNKNLNDFFLIVLEGMGIREKLNYTNGAESNEGINEFLKLIKTYFDNQKPNLQDFIFWFDNSDLSLNRDNNITSCVKISTVHGAKGLESKIVILVDSCILPIQRDNILFDEDNNIFFPGKNSNLSDYAKKLFHDENIFDEYLRLLYVALTRAKQQLIICGYANSKANEDSWYNICYQGIFPHANIVDFEYGSVDEKKLSITEGERNSYNINKDNYILDDLVHYNEVDLQLEQKNSNFINKLDDVKAKNIVDNDSLEYGIVFHKIMQYVVKHDLNQILNNKFWLKQFPEKFHKKIYEKINILNHSNEFIKLQKEYKLYSEISFVLDKKVGRIDLLAIGNEEIIIFDYKTDENPPKNSQEVNKDYIDQINFYKLAISKLYSTKKVKAKILWLENIEFMELH
jgi:ATP-dependent helicase/nuclease subunit A